MQRGRRKKTTGEKYFVLIAIVFYAAIYNSAPVDAIKAVNFSTDIFFDVILLVLAGICLGGLVKASLPEDFVSSHLGPDVGRRAYLNSVLVAAILPGEAYVRIPLFEAFLTKGAGIGPFTSLSTARPVIVNFPQGMAFLGLPVAIIQVFSTVFGALTAGLFAGILQSKFEIVKPDSRPPRQKDRKKYNNRKREG
ncbi:permease [archaeon]|nr:permease [archaeon]